MLTAKRLRELLSYDPLTGIFTRLVATSRRIRVGDTAGCKNPNGYIEFSVENKLYKAHRLAWLYATGEWPTHEIDHRNGIRDDNRLCNLRAATKSENLQNVTQDSGNKAGVVGVSPHKGRWKVRIQHNKQGHYLGLFSTTEEAHAAYLAKKAELHTFQPTPRSAT